jgi:hypothetical protein
MANLFGPRTFFISDQENMSALKEFKTSGWVV